MNKEENISREQMIDFIREMDRGYRFFTFFGYSDSEVFTIYIKVQKKNEISKAS